MGEEVEEGVGEGGGWGLSLFLEILVSAQLIKTLAPHVGASLVERGRWGWMLRRVSLLLLGVVVVVVVVVVGVGLLLVKRRGLGRGRAMGIGLVLRVVGMAVLLPWVCRLAVVLRRRRCVLLRLQVVVVLRRRQGRRRVAVLGG